MPGTLASRAGGLESFNPACNQQQAKADDPRPGRDRLTDADHAKLGEQRNHKQDQGDHPHDEGRSFAGKITHGVSLWVVR